MEEVKLRNLNFKRKITIILFYLLLGITSYLLFSYYIQYKQIITPLQPNETKYEVSLSHGTLYFNNYKFPEEEEYNYDSTKIYTKKITTNKYIDYLGIDPRPKEIKYVPNEITTSPQTQYYNKKDTIVNDTYKFTYTNSSKSKYVNIYVSKNKEPNYSPLKDIKELDISEIFKTPLKICYYKDYNKQYHFLAQFEYNKIGYTITSFNLSQEEFIKTLYTIVD